MRVEQGVSMVRGGEIIEASSSFIFWAPGLGFTIHLEVSAGWGRVSLHMNRTPVVMVKALHGKKLRLRDWLGVVSYPPS